MVTKHSIFTVRWKSWLIQANIFQPLDRKLSLLHTNEMSNFGFRNCSQTLTFVGSTIVNQMVSHMITFISTIFFFTITSSNDSNELVRELFNCKEILCNYTRHNWSKDDLVHLNWFMKFIATVCKYAFLSLYKFKFTNNRF